MRNKQDKTHCISIFKDSANINFAFSTLWAKVINQLEQTKYTPGPDTACKARHNENVQSRNYHNQMIESCAQKWGADPGVSDQ